MELLLPQYPLPVTMTVGGSYRWHGVLMSMDLEKVNDLGPTTRIGAEYAPVRYLTLRGGWIGGDETALSGLTGGVGSGKTHVAAQAHNWSRRALGWGMTLATLTWRPIFINYPLWTDCSTPPP